MGETPRDDLFRRILDRNRAYASSREVRPLPPVEPRRLAVVACYDPRLDELLLPAFGLRPGEAFFLRTAGALVRPGGGILRSLGLAVFMFEVTDIAVVGHTSCRMADFKAAEFADLFRGRGVSRDAFGAEDLREWAGAIPDPRRGVQASMHTIASAAYMPRDVSVFGFVLDDTTGRLEVVPRVEGTAQVGVQQAEQAPAEPAKAEATPGPQLEALVEWVADWLRTVESKGIARQELAQLRKDLAAERSTLRRIERIEEFARRASAGSKQVASAFGRIRGEIEGAADGRIPPAVQRLFQGGWGSS